jgi:hypothetical protein
MNKRSRELAKIREQRGRPIVYAYLTSLESGNTSLGMYGMEFAMVDSTDLMFHKADFKEAVGIEPGHILGHAIPKKGDKYRSNYQNVLYAEKPGQDYSEYEKIVKKFREIGFDVRADHGALDELLKMQQQLYFLSKR